MCGVAGLLESPGRAVDGAALDAMTRAQAHRGPDGAGSHLAGPVGLGHRRLAVIDLAGGAQPLFNEDRTLALIVNGELYNYRELSAELIESGHRFRTASDAECLVHLYEELGVEAVKRVRGMFAFALWDSRLELLVLGRDRLGQKPLYYGAARGRFGFASSLDALVAGLGPLTLDFAALDAYLTLGYVPSPLSIYHEARKLPPGHLALVRPGGEPTLLRYWEPPAGERLRFGRRAAVKAVREALSESVELRLRSDVPVGLFLSGGVDSSVVGAAMAELSPGPVASFTAGFDEPDYDESRYGREAAERLGLEHHTVEIRPEATASLDQVVRGFGEPFADSSALATWWLARGARPLRKVVLTGDGGDELFAGYPRYRILKRLALVSGLLPRPLARGLARLPLPRRLRRAAEVIALPPERRPIELLALFDQRARRRLFRSAVTPELAEDALARLYEERGATLLERLLHADLASYLPDDLLVKMDVSTMAHGLEARAPLLDHELVELVLRLPEPLRAGDGRGKALLRDAWGGRFPRGFFDRPKQGFGVPIRHWLRQGLADSVRDALRSERLASLELLDLDEAHRLIGEHELGRREHHHRLWALLVLGRWLELAPPFRWRGAVR